MEIKAIRMFDGGFMNQLFAFGGEEGKDAFDDKSSTVAVYRTFLSTRAKR